MKNRRYFSSRFNWSVVYGWITFEKEWFSRLRSSQILEASIRVMRVILRQFFGVSLEPFACFSNRIK